MLIFVFASEGDAFLFTVSYDSKFYRSNTPCGRIQPVSKKPPEPERFVTRVSYH